MVGLVIASHGGLASELVATAKEIIGDFPGVATCSVPPGASPSDLRSVIKAAMSEVDQGEGVLVFSDLIGGSPCMQSLSLCRDSRVEVLTGVNLPMLLKAATLRLKPMASLRDFAHEVAAHGQRNITCATDSVRPARAAG